MRNTLRLIGIIALAVIIGFSMAACDNGTTSSGNSDTEEIPQLKDYSVTGVNQSYAYGSQWQVNVSPLGNAPGGVTIKYNGSVAKPVTAGTYTVSFDVPAAAGWRANAGIQAGWVTILDPTVAPPTLLTPNTNSYTKNGLTQTYTGEPKYVSIVPTAGATVSPGRVTVFYTGANVTYPRSDIAPSGRPNEATTYTIQFNVEAVSGSWNAGTNLVGGTLTISPANDYQRDPREDDFNIVGTGVKDYIEGELYYRVSVSVKDPEDGSPTITVRYPSSPGTDGIKASNVGTHPVYFDVGQGGNFKAKTGLFAGNITVTQGEEISNSTVSKFFDISGLSQVYAGATAREVQIVPRYGYAGLQTSLLYEGISPTRYGPSSNAPSSIGKYKVTFSVEGDGFKKVSDLTAGDLTIANQVASPDTLKISDFEIAGEDGNPWNTDYNFSKDVVISVQPLASKKGDIGLITVKYLKQGETLPHTYSPENAGYYTVTFDVAASEKYDSITAMPAGTLTINKADNPDKQFGIVVTGGGNVTFDGVEKKVSIYVPALGYTAPDTAVWYDGSNTAPSDVGEYSITYDIVYDPNGNWTGRSRIDAGKLNITRAYPARSNFGNATLTGKTYDGKPASVSAPDGIGGLLYSKATKGLTFIRESDGKKVIGGPTDAGTYEAYLTLAADDKNWYPTEGDGLILDQKITITKRTPVEADFDIIAGQRLDQFAYGTNVTQVSFQRVTPRPVVEYPNAATIRADFYLTPTAAGTTALSAVQALDPGTTLYVGINLASLENWNAVRLTWPFVLKPWIFDNANQFVDWYNGLRAGNTIYEARFKDGAITTAADIKKIALAIKDTGAYGTTPNTSTTHPDYWTNATPSVPVPTNDPTGDGKFPSTNNGNKRLNLNLSGGAITTLAALTGVDGGFKDCTNLRVLNLSGNSSITGASGVDAANSFSGCTNLTTLKLPANLTSVGSTAANSALATLSALTDLDVGGVTTDFTNVLLHATPSINLTVNKVVFTGDGTAAGNFENSKIKSLVITSSDVTLAPRTFKDCNSLTSVSFPDNFGAKVIAADAFKGCKALSGVVFPGSEGTAWTGSIAAGAFDGCTSLAIVTLPVIPSDAAGINATAFGGSDAALRTLTLGGNLAADTAAFAGKSNLRWVYLNAETSTVSAITASSDADAADKPGIFEDCTRLNTVYFPATGFTTIGTRAFKGCRQLVIDIPNTVNAIGASAFEDCLSIEAITIPVAASSPLSRIFPKAFKNTGLINVTIPQSITEINEEAFANCRYLTKVTLANTTTGTPNPTALALLGQTSTGTLGGSFADCINLETFGKADVVSGVTYPVTGVCAIPGTVFVAKVDSFKNTKFSKIVIDSVTGTTVNGNAFSGASFAANSLEVTGTAAPTAGFDFGSAAAFAVPSIRTITWGVETLAVANNFTRTGLNTLVLVKKLTTTPAATYPATGFTTLKIDLDDQDADITLGMPDTIANVFIGEKANGTGLALGNASATANSFGASNIVKNLTFTGAIGTFGDKFLVGIDDIKLRIDNAGINTQIAASLRGIVPPSSFTTNIYEEVSLGAPVKTANELTNFVSTKLKAIKVDDGNDYYGNYQNDGVLYGRNTNRVMETLLRYPAAKDDVTSYETPSMITRIAAKAFSGNDVIETLTINENIAFIEGDSSGSTGAFDGMGDASGGLREVIFKAKSLSPSGVLTASKFPATVNKVTFTEAVTRIPASFAGTGITELIIPVNVVEMAPNAFMTCASLKTVRFYPVELTTGSTAAFSGVASITELYIGDNVKIIPANTFKGTQSKLPINNLTSVQTIGAGAFEDSAIAGTFTIPATCTSIGDTAFGGAAPCGVTVFYFYRVDTVIAAATAFRAKGSAGVELKDCYETNKAGIYSWVEDGTPANNTWAFTALP
jgi:hypothetical protein